ncbi:hypothetical protein EON65_28325 [archaeon]|nr:MAG: hypothetical protein EON65_28325 [archaeon]
MSPLSQEKIHNLALRFKEAEWAWLNSLPDETKAILSRSQEDGEFDPSLLTHYGAFFLTLLGIKPCFLIANPDYPEFAIEFIENVMVAFMPELKGFEIFRAAQYDNNSLVFVFTSRYHAKFHLIKELILTPRQQTGAPAELLGKALGYPVPGGDDYVLSYVDDTTSKELGVTVVVFEYTARMGFDMNIRMHFQKCASEFRKLGKVLSIVCQH